MNEVTRPALPWGTTLSAVATVAALAVLLIFASVAAGASDPLTGGTTSLTLKKGFAKKLSNNEVKLLKSGSGKVSWPDRASSAWPAARSTRPRGRARSLTSGGFKLKNGKRTAKVTAVTIDVTGKAVSAKVGGKSMKLGSLAGVSLARSGDRIDVTARSLKLTGRAANALNDKLGLNGKFKAGNAVSNARSAAQVQSNVPAQIPLVEPPAPNMVVNVMTRNLYLGADLTPGDRSGHAGSLRRGQREDPAGRDSQRLPDPGRGPGG